MVGVGWFWVWLLIAINNNFLVLLWQEEEPKNVDPGTCLAKSHHAGTQNAHKANRF